jgi:hypothetical protein
MSSRKNQVLLNVLLGTGVYLLDSMRNRLSGASLDDLRTKADDLRTKANETYDTAVDRFSRANDVIRGNDRQLMGPVVAGLLGLGIGVGVGFLLAPESGQETRNNIANQARDIRDRISSREPATGTFGA